MDNQFFSGDVWTSFDQVDHLGAVVLHVHPPR